MLYEWVPVRLAEIPKKEELAQFGQTPWMSEPIHSECIFYFQPYTKTVYAANFEGLFWWVLVVRG